MDTQTPHHEPTISVTWHSNTILAQDAYDFFLI